jgi:thiamine kinase-like enzyme
MVGSHRDLHPTNVMRLDHGRGFMPVDWDAAGPVVPGHEIACFAPVHLYRDWAVTKWLSRLSVTSLSSGWPIECHCSAAECRGVVTGNDWQLP